MFDVKNNLGTEVWSASALHHAAWPDSDPSGSSQPEARWDESHSELLRQAVENFELNPAAFLAKTAGMEAGDRLWSLLTHRAFNFNGSSVRTEGHWVERVRGALRRGEPVQIAYPLVCKIGNPAKRMTLVGTTAGERATVRFFKRIGELAKAIYPPGIVVNVLSDATLYNGALQVPPPSAYAYMKDFGALIDEEGAGGSIRLHDYSELLAPYYREFEAAYTQAYRYLGSPTDVTLDETARTSLPTSIRASLNSRRLGLDYGSLRNLFGPHQVEFEPVRRVLDVQAEQALREQLAIKLACDQLDLPDRLWPDNVRATCHRGPKHGRAVLGLRCYPEYYGRSKLLPYHGMPLIEVPGEGSPKLSILPEISLYGRDDLTRVVDARGEPVLYIGTAS